METSVQNGSVIFTHGQDRFTVTLHRTLRLPEDGNTYELPPSMGNFPIKRVEDYKDKVPKEWLKHGGVFFPMWQREAMWLQFNCSRRPFACKVAAGKINAVSGKPWQKALAPAHEDGDCEGPRQDYCVAPTQRWLDGFNAGDGIIKQFVAMPLGQGYTVEGQVTGKEDFGGIQIMAVPPKDGKLEPKPPRRGSRLSRGMTEISENSTPHTSETLDFSNVTIGASASYGTHSVSAGVNYYSASNINTLSLEEAMAKRPEMYKDFGVTRSELPKAAEMGLAAGGSMVQKIYPDPHGLDTWNEKQSGRMFIHIVNSEMYEQITGERPPKSPITAHDYLIRNYPWFKVWDEEFKDVSASSTLKGVKTVSEKDKEHGFTGQQNDNPLQGITVVSTGKPHIFIGQEVKDGTW